MPPNKIKHLWLSMRSSDLESIPKLSHSSITKSPRTNLKYIQPTMKSYSHRILCTWFLSNCAYLMEPALISWCRNFRKSCSTLPINLTQGKFLWKKQGIINCALYLCMWQINKPQVTFMVSIIIDLCWQNYLRSWFLYPIGNNLWRAWSSTSRIGIFGRQSS